TYVKVDVAPEMDCATGEFSRGNDYEAATGRGARLDRLAECFRAIKIAAGHGPKLRDVEIASGKHGRSDPGQYLLQVSPRIVLPYGLCRARKRRPRRKPVRAHDQSASANHAHFQKIAATPHVTFLAIHVIGGGTRHPATRRDCGRYGWCFTVSS